MKKLLILILTLTLLLPYFVSCAKLINTETQEVDATVTDVYYRGMWLQPIKSGKTTTYITHPAQYKVTFTYDNISTTVDDKELYEYYKNKIGITVKCDLTTKYYDDGTVRQTLELKEENK